jgi:hypothetical protein
VEEYPIIDLSHLLPAAQGLARLRRTNASIAFAPTAGSAIREQSRR